MSKPDYVEAPLDIRPLLGVPKEIIGQWTLMEMYESYHNTNYDPIPSVRVPYDEFMNITSEQLKELCLSMVREVK